MTQLAANAQNPQLRKEQQVTVNAVTGKKKIMPKIERIFDDSNALVNPHLNPFMQLNENQNNQKTPAKKEVIPQVLPPPVKEMRKLPTMNEVVKQVNGFGNVKMAEEEVKEVKLLPKISEIASLQPAIQPQIIPKKQVEAPKIVPVV